MFKIIIRILDYLEIKKIFMEREVVFKLGVHFKTNCNTLFFSFCPNFGQGENRS